MQVKEIKGFINPLRKSRGRPGCRRGYRIVDGVAFVAVAPDLEATVDVADLATALSYRWSRATGGYPMTTIKAAVGRSTLYLHRLLLDAPRQLHVDHINGNPLDNRRCNLRLVTAAENQQNRTKPPKSQTGLRGVSVCPKTGRFVASASINGKRHHLGTFDTAEEAARAAADGRKRLMTHAVECLPAPSGERGPR